MKKAEKLRSEKAIPPHHFPMVQGMHNADTCDIWAGFFELACELKARAEVRRKAQEIEQAITEIVCQPEKMT